MQATDGDANRTKPKNPLPPSQPEVVTLSGAEFELYISGQKRGQSEGLKESISAIFQAKAHFEKHGDAKVLDSLAAQLAGKAKQLDIDQTIYLGRYITLSKPGLWQRLKAAIRNS